ncbi:hypothetical protein BpHYR1_026251 [Brachionus plicatilis]|uniref:Uncharacterized protein n=1 Tax=Brachionus plicatilis TaxID=10195 RepID=A0A3M7P4P4_BRAPC|nr:hypothetical protein BpHYR1_026251 [Brachionus plicatilis]
MACKMQKIAETKLSLLIELKRTSQLQIVSYYKTSLKKIKTVFYKIYSTLEGIHIFGVKAVSVAFAHSVTLVTLLIQIAGYGSFFGQRAIYCVECCLTAFYVQIEPVVGKKSEGLLSELWFSLFSGYSLLIDTSPVGVSQIVLFIQRENL